MSHTQHTLSQLHPQDSLEAMAAPSASSYRVDGMFQTGFKELSRDPTFFRRYAPGDPYFSIDWRSYARNDHLIVREKTKETANETAVHLYLGASTDWPRAEEKKRPIHGTTKREVMLRLGLQLLFYHGRNHDTVSLILHEENPAQSLLFPRLGLAQIIEIYEKYRTTNFQQVALGHGEALTHKKKWQRNYFVSDLIHTTQAVLETAKPRDQIIHILHSGELEIAWLPEQAHCSGSDPHFIHRTRTLLRRNLYQRKLQSWLKQLEQSVRTRGLHYFLGHDLTAKQYYLSYLENSFKAQLQRY